MQTLPFQLLLEHLNQTLQLQAANRIHGCARLHRLYQIPEVTERKTEKRAGKAVICRTGNHQLA